NLTNGGKATLESDIYIGFTAIGNGTVTVDGSGSALESTGFGYLYVGDRGTGSLVLTDGGKATSVRDIDIGCETGSHGTVLVGTGSSLTSTTGNVYVGGGSYAAGGTGLLAGTGTVSANAGAGNVVVYNTGTLSAGDAAEQIGTLNIAGNLDMRSGSTMLVDFNSATSGIAPFSTAGNIDKILVSGTATFGSTLNVSLSSVVGISTLPGRNIVETQGGITTAVPTGVFTLNGLSTIGSRVDLSGLTLVLADGNKNLQIGGAAFAENKFLTWSGDANNNWDITSINWTDDADGSPIKFLDGDAVTFDTDATPDAVINIEGTQKTVAQMVVGGDEDLTINGNILADNTLSTLDGTPGIDGGLTKNGSGMLMLNGDDRFKGDVTLNGGTLEVTGSITAPVLVMNNGTTFVNGTASPENVKFSQLDVHGSANWQGNLDMANNLMNFYVPATMGNGGVMLDVDGMANIAGATVNVGIDGASSPLHAGDHIVLIDANKLTGTTSNTIADGSGMHGVTLKYDFRIETMGDQLWATLLDSSINPQTKALSEGFLAGTTLLNHTGGRISGSGMNGAVAAAKRERICGYGIFGDISGNRSRYDTESNSGSNSGSSAGSNIDLSGMSVIAGVSKCLPSNSGFLTVGAFFDYGTGSYDTFNAFDNAESVRGNGKLNHFGGGVLGRMDFHNQFYAETGFRAGRLSNDYYSADLRDGAGRAASFDAASAYYGLHAGVGKWWSFTNKATLDIYAKYLWSGLQNNSVTLSTGDPVAFQSVNSHRLQLGGRYAFGTIRQSPFSGVWQQFSPYLGAAWEQEFDGTARATTRGNAIDAPSLRGGTGIGEAGIAWNPAARRGFHADLGVQGYIGKREGIVASLFVEQKF
ncbi:MAG: autotransporter domain-containing protein, partial [Planctomycetaceae bacterium]|nr:autotransporter domain-containing protein [Planctomycetaceae bacterium]